MNHNRKIIYLAGFLFSIPVALTAYINSSFLSTFVGEKSVSLIYALGSILSVLALLIAPKILRRFGGYKFLLGITITSALALLFLTFALNAISAAIAFILYFCINILIFFTLDEFLKIFSKDSATGKVRGMYIALCNAAWILSQLASGTILGGFSFRTIYFIGSLVMLMLLMLLFLNLEHIPDPAYDKASILKYLKEFSAKKNLVRAYGMSFLLQFFYCWMVIYTPIYLSAHLGFTWSQIGIIFTIMILPFSIIPWKLGKYADKFGERKILMIGFSIASLATLALFFLGSQTLWVWAAMLFITRVGAATIEVMVDSYFFKHIRPENDEYVGVFRSATPVAYIVGPILAFVTLLLVPSFHYIYIVLGIIMLKGVYIASGISRKDI